MPRRLMVRLRILIPSIEVRILAGHPIFPKSLIIYAYLLEPSGRYGTVHGTPSGAQAGVPAPFGAKVCDCGQTAALNSASPMPS